MSRLLGAGAGALPTAVGEGAGAGAAADTNTDTGLTKRTREYRQLNCNDCNRKFCLGYELPTCKGAKEDDVVTTCFRELAQLRARTELHCALRIAFLCLCLCLDI